MIADIEDELIIGMDIMNSKGFKRKFQRRILEVENEEMMHQSKEETVRVVLTEDMMQRGDIASNCNWQDRKRKGDAVRTRMP